MTTDNGTAPAGRDASDPAVALSLKVLFGDAFVAGLEPAFLESFVTRGPTWGRVLKALWELSAGQGVQDVTTGAHGPAGLHTASVDAVRDPAPVQAAPPAETPAQPAPAQPAPAQPAPAPAPEANGNGTNNANGTSNGNGADTATSRFEVFDPALDSVQTPALRAEPWTYEEVRDALVALLEEATGYPAEVLDDDADLEADLAIDSVKQVEALGALRERYGLTLEDDFAIRDYRTIRKASSYMLERLNSERVSAAGN
ncbi:phosphopantetheine-binding protein [Streptomyces sp. ODS28]|uniref:acyl carrier protein n=1 Tax=Streptomyces sp. ODS28 TaxID=3136688 RepID=UPI0031EEAE70